jgi:DNA invertase Pin-like site-specific DNA recombinase
MNRLQLSIGSTTVSIEGPDGVEVWEIAANVKGILTGYKPASRKAGSVIGKYAGVFGRGRPLTAKVRAEILHDYQGGMTQKEIADEYGVSLSAVSRAVNSNNQSVLKRAHKK